MADDSYIPRHEQPNGASWCWFAWYPVRVDACRRFNKEWLPVRRWKWLTRVVRQDMRHYGNHSVTFAELTKGHRAHWQRRAAVEHAISERRSGS